MKLALKLLLMVEKRPRRNCLVDERRTLHEDRGRRTCSSKLAVIGQNLLQRNLGGERTAHAAEDVEDSSEGVMSKSRRAGRRRVLFTRLGASADVVHSAETVAHRAEDKVVRG